VLNDLVEGPTGRLVVVSEGVVGFQDGDRVVRAGGDFPRELEARGPTASDHDGCVCRHVVGTSK